MIIVLVVALLIIMITIGGTKRCTCERHTQIGCARSIHGRFYHESAGIDTPEQCNPTEAVDSCRLYHKISCLKTDSSTSK